MGIAAKLYAIELILVVSFLAPKILNGDGSSKSRAEINELETLNCEMKFTSLARDTKTGDEIYKLETLNRVVKLQAGDPEINFFELEIPKATSELKALKCEPGVYSYKQLRVYHEQGHACKGIAGY